MNSKNIEVDGAQGEGGGQVLRTSLSLAMCTGRPVHIFNIRAKRKKPGLMRQHLTAVQAAVEVSGGKVDGAAAGAQEIVFVPDAIKTGEYHFAIGTAGSCTLVLQTILPPLLTAAGNSKIILEGGTHNPMAPPFEFLQRAFLPLINRMGPRVEAELERAGFFPAGGGRIVVHIQPCKKLAPLQLEQRGCIVTRRATAWLAGLSENIARRELAVVRKQLHWDESELHIGRAKAQHGVGNVVTLEVISEHLTEVFTSFGEKGIAAETVATRAIAEAAEYLGTDAAVGRHLADQLMLPLALAGAGEFTMLTPSEHCTTNMQVIQAVLGIQIKMKNIGKNSWHMAVRG